MLTPIEKAELTTLLRTAADDIDADDFNAARLKVTEFVAKAMKYLYTGAAMVDRGEVAANIARRIFGGAKK